MLTANFDVPTTRTTGRPRYWESQYTLHPHVVGLINTYARTIVATFDASVSNPQAMRQAPIKLLPRYPAGSVMRGIPPDILVAPPSSAKQARSTDQRLAQGKSN